ncbi:MAG: hypothetical protein IJ071_11510 [Ruminococcus sp.]|nr:hypothetical protein [Ruminococcus sp.]
MRNSNMKKRIAAAAASAVMSVTAVTGSLGSAVVANLGFVPTVSAAAESSVKVIASVGYGEGMYATWSSVSGASGYNVYVDGKQIDSMLIRQYYGYMRADAVGLKSGSHTMKIVPIISGKEDSSKAAETTATAYAHDRSGFGFVNGSSSGAYNDDGTLKSNATVIYVTNSNKDSVSVSLPDKKGNATTLTGVQNIITDLKSNTSVGPVCIRFIGNIEDPATLTKGDLMIDTATCGLTVEGIGNDATLNGFGLVMKNSSNVEVRNLGFMNCNSNEGDNCGLQQGNDHVWVHNCDFFYGDAGTDADQVKGDGALDTKTSSYVTHSYNHFWDNGKCNLQGMKSESTDNYITYHHNWYDHSDSRHPRVRTCTVHCYNNYFDGNAKYGVGATLGCSIFVENNYFRNCPKPMMSSKQGTDALGDGTFSGENGGIIKSFGNYMEGVSSYITYQQNSSSFDAYEASSRSESVPSSVKTVAGSTTYNNFDTASSMYKYTADAAADVPSIVTAKAGRVDGGDFQWQFNNSVDDASYAVNDALKAALVSYKGTVQAIGSGFKEDDTPAPAATDAPSTTPAATQTTAAPSTTPTVTPAAGSYIHNFTENGTSSSFYTISGNLSTAKGTASYNGLTLTQCLKIESATSISFNAPSAGTLTLVFGDASSTIKLDGNKLTSDGSGVLTTSVSAGSHTLAKADTANLFYMVYSGDGSAPVVTQAPQQTDTPAVTTAAPSQGSTSVGDVKVVSAGGWNEMAWLVLSGLKDSDVTGVSYSGASSGTLTGDDFTYLVRDTNDGLRVDLLGLKPGTYSISLDTTKGSFTKTGISVAEQDRSGYAHFNYSAGVGAYTDGGTLKANAKVIYVTNDNKDTVTVTSKDGTTVKGIGNILNSTGMDAGNGQTPGGGKANTNQGIIKKLAQDGTPLVVRIIGDVKAPTGLTAYDSVDYGGSVGDNGYMARMKSGKDVTIEGVGTDATVNGWGFHFIAESAAPDYGKSFEVRNIHFRNVPEDCVGMEGVQSGSTLTATVERCWIHNCEFYVPSISNPAESDKAQGDGACDFKRGMYFTNSYCYYEGYHKTNLVGASDSNLQFHLTYHHNYWKNCESRGPLARQANIHMYNNVFDGQTSYCMNPRANAYIFSEYNVFNNSKNPMQIKLGAIKSYNDVFSNCKGDQQGTIVTDKSTKVSSDNTYANFDTNSSICYIPSGNYKLDTASSSDLFSKLSSVFDALGGCMDGTNIPGGDFYSDAPQATQTTTAAPAPVTTTATAALVVPTTTEPSTDRLLGDVNNNGTVNLNDAVSILQYVANGLKYPLSDSDLDVADVYNRGDGVNGMDALSIQKYDAGLLTALPESVKAG